jgi:hypothetical protein
VWSERKTNTGGTQNETDSKKNAPGGIVPSRTGGLTTKQNGKEKPMREEKETRPASATGRTTTPTINGRCNTARRGKQLFTYRKPSRRAGGGESAQRHELEAIEIHELAKLVPEMTPREYQDLCDDIREKGQLEPIMLYEGKILDGRHRDQACRELGIQRKIETYKGIDPAGFIISKNIKRRHLHLTKQEQVRLITKLLGASNKDYQMPPSRWKKGVVGSTKDEFKAAVVEHAEQVGISRPTVEKTWSEIKREQQARKPQAAPKREPKKVDKLAPEYIHKRFGMFLKHWPSHTDQRKVRAWVKEYLSP